VETPSLPPGAEAKLRDIRSVTDAALSHLGADELLATLLSRVREILDADTAAVPRWTGGGDDRSPAGSCRNATGLSANSFHRTHCGPTHGTTKGTGTAGTGVDGTRNDRADAHELPRQPWEARVCLAAEPRSV
jgi:hypothetical protein